MGTLEIAFGVVTDITVDAVADLEVQEHFLITTGEAGERRRWPLKEIDHWRFMGFRLETRTDGQRWKIPFVRPGIGHVRHPFRDTMPTCEIGEFIAAVTAPPPPSISPATDRG